MNHNLEMVLRLLLATFLGAVIGFQREWSGKEAGLRTNMLICLGAALIALASLNGFPGNTGQVAAGIVTGVGFIGAGVILHRTGGEVSGLTTAATILVVAGIGIAAGAGLYVISSVTAALTLLILFLPHIHRPKDKQ